MSEEHALHTPITYLSKHKNKIDKEREMKQSTQAFRARTYGKQELALLYFPQSLPRTAANHLMAWIRHCPALWAQLDEMGYQPRSRTFSPRQVRAIVDYLGTPD